MVYTKSEFDIRISSLIHKERYRSAISSKLDLAGLIKFNNYLERKDGKGKKGEKQKVF